MTPTREMLRMAQRLRAYFEQWLPVHARSRRTAWEQLEQRLVDLRRLWRLTETARRRDWLLAAAKLDQDIATALKASSAAMRELREEYLERSPSAPTLKDLLADLQQLFDEFNHVTVDARRRTIDVQSGVIVLEGVDLGSFLIRLHAPRLAERSDVECFEIVALEPNPASGDESVTHPHVRSRRLCAGDATLPLHLALGQGRLVDAFCLVHAVLEKYNADSSHIRLKEWEDISCWSCGVSAGPDDRHFCESCEKDICFECTTSCRRCGGVYCPSCQTRCDVCHAPCCHRCLTTSACSELKCCAKCLAVCASCKLKVALSELESGTALCPACRVEPSESSDPC